MNKYLLLRDHEQSGPFSFEEIKAQNLQSTDLVWILGVSNGWSYANEVKELQVLADENARTSNTVPTATPMASIPGRHVSVPHLKTNYSRPLDEIKQMYVHHLQKTSKTKKYKIGLAAAIIAAFFLGGLLIKNITTTPKEVEIKVADVNRTPSGEPTTNSENFQNALSKEFVPIETKPKKAKPKDLKKMIGVEANDYHVRLLGGINDLKLTIQNYSEHLLDKVIVKVDYLKPKGDIVNSEQVIVRNIKPMESKSIDVPPSSRGVKIKYSIISVHSQDYKALLEEI